MSVTEMYNCIIFFRGDNEMFPGCDSCILGDVNTVPFSTDKPMKKRPNLVAGDRK